MTAWTMTPWTAAATEMGTMMMMTIGPTARQSLTWTKKVDDDADADADYDPSSLLASDELKIGSGDQLTTDAADREAHTHRHRRKADTANTVTKGGGSSCWVVIDCDRLKMQVTICLR